MSVSTVPITKLQECQGQYFEFDLSQIYQDSQTIYTLALNNLSCSGITLVNYVTWVLSLDIIKNDGTSENFTFGPSDEYNPNYSPVFPKQELYDFLNLAINYWEIFLNEYSIKVNYNSESFLLTLIVEGCNNLNSKPVINFNPTLSYICN
jgi:hypothetical protein